MRKALAVVLLGFGVLGIASAAIPVPEINAGSAPSALALLAGAILVIRSRRRK